MNRRLFTLSKWHSFFAPSIKGRFIRPSMRSLRSLTQDEQVIVHPE
jgi:hypothetical protein